MNPAFCFDIQFSEFHVQSVEYVIPQHFMHIITYNRGEITFLSYIFTNISLLLTIMSTTNIPMVTFLTPHVFQHQKVLPSISFFVLVIKIKVLKLYSHIPLVAFLTPLVLNTEQILFKCRMWK
jgi:hypothetical protein